MKKTNDKLIWRNDVADMLGVCSLTIERWHADPAKNFPRRLRFGRKIFFDREEVMRWIESHRAASIAAE